jgi:hypothetical protein
MIHDLARMLSELFFNLGIGSKNNLIKRRD